MQFPIKWALTLFGKKFIKKIYWDSLINYYKYVKMYSRGKLNFVIFTGLINVDQAL